MARERTEHSTFPSKYAPGEWITAAQYIIELVCENAAKHSNRDLPLRFWKNDGWSTFFTSQTRAVNRLLKKYDSRAILAVVKRKNLRSLIPKWIEQVIQQEQEQLEFNRKKLLDEQRSTIQRKPRIISKQKGSMLKTGSLNKLLAIDEEIENG